ncbi:MAG: class I SAM-dependent methyltransferase [Thermodesulfobacteriota bacterium]
MGREERSALYDRTYFLSHCGGHEVYAEARGDRLDSRLGIVLQMSRLAPGMRVLDLGCGRGELLLHGARLGASVVGLDLSEDALNISRETVGCGIPEKGPMPGLVRGSSDLLPFRDRSFHRVLLSDILEHLFPAEMKGTLKEIHRVLREDGLVIFHTFPNRWFYSIYYPLRRLLWDRPLGKAGPRDPRSRYERVMHVNELSPWDLIRAMKPFFHVRISCAHRSRWDKGGCRFRKGRGPLDWLREPEIWGSASRRR